MILERLAIAIDEMPRCGQLHLTGLGIEEQRYFCIDICLVCSMMNPCNQLPTKPHICESGSVFLDHCSRTCVALLQRLRWYVSQTQKPRHRLGNLV